MKKKIIVLVLFLLAIGYGAYRLIGGKTSEITYKTSNASRGTLVTSIAATGSVSSGNTTNIVTKASGTVKQVLVENGDTVKKGQTLLVISLDSEGIERKSSAWKNYLSEQEAVVLATKEKQDLEIQVWKDKQAILDAEEAKEEKNLHASDNTDSENNQIDLSVTQSKLAFDVTAAKFSHSDELIAAAKIAMNASYLDYQDVSGTIVAPADGIVNNLTLTVGSTLSANSSQSTSSGATYASSQNIGFIRSSSNEYLVKVSLTEVDVTKVEAGQKVSLTLDSHSDKTFTGRVLAVDVSGVNASGVVSYPATIVMDSTELPIYPNMSVTANIIVNTKTDVLLVPKSAITMSNGESSVRVMKNDEPQIVSVELGDSNGTQSEIISGLSEGEEVVIGSNNSTKNNNTSSAFSGTRMMGGPGF